MRGAPARSMIKIISKTAAFATRLPFSSLASPVFEESWPRKFGQ
ncbi:hypothetical protein ACVIU7_003164 [Bradyrhizobium liaoningense]